MRFKKPTSTLILDFCSNSASGYDKGKAKLDRKLKVIKNVKCTETEANIKEFKEKHTNILPWYCHKCKEDSTKLANIELFYEIVEKKISRMKRKVEKRKEDIRKTAEKKAKKRLEETKQKCPHSGLSIRKLIIIIYKL